MRAELIKDPAAIAAITAEWRALAVPNGNAFVTPDWFESWLELEPDSNEPLVAAVRDDDGRLAGVMPLVLDSARWPRMVRFAGASFGDRFMPAASPEEQLPVAQATIEALRAERIDRNVVMLDHVDVGTPWCKAMQQGPEVGRACVEQQPAELPYIELEGLDWEGYLAGRSRNFRSQVRRRERALERDHDVVVRAATAESLDDDLDIFFDLHERRWRERGTSSLQKPCATELIRGFATRAEEQGWLRLRLLEADGEPVAAFLGWRIGPTYSFYQSGFDPDWADKSVGIVLLASTIRDAIDEGASDFDLLLGNESYKARFATASRDVHTVVVSNARGPIRLLVRGEASIRRGGRALAQRPALAGVARRARRLLATER